jgi:hypothetical protein
MRTRITAKWLKKKRACTSDEENRQAEEIGDVRLVVEELMKQDRFNDANWLITRKLNVDENRMYAINAAKLALPIFEKEFPDDNRPRKAIEAAEKYLKHKTKKNKKALIRAAAVAYAAVAYAYVAAAAEAAADAAVAAADADAVAAEAAVAAADAAVAAADAAEAADDAVANIKKDIINYGLKLLYEEV